jgi:hypothetical protein
MTKDGCHSKQYPVQPSMTAASSVYGSGSNLGEMNTPLSMASNLDRPVLSTGRARYFVSATSAWRRVK